jgi:hypothetical protein
MEFDNAQFERGVSTTISTLGKLTEALKFKGATTGLSDIHAAAGKVNFQSISDGIEGVSKKFIALSTIAITALSNITTAAISAGLNFAKSFALGPLMSGFKEFETNVNSIQTILANTKSQGTNLDQVNAALDQLNQYSDKTIYNFSQMAKNIGTFTAAGVDLNTSVSAIKGIANLAAISGSNAEQASSAMYQLSQALASGTVKLMDWNSVVMAGMGGEVFKNALFESGKALGALADVPVDQTFDQWEASGNNFRSSLESGWLTAEVLTTTLGGISGELSQIDLEAKGFSASAAAQMVELGKLGIDSATSVRTFTQLMGTVKESVASGWSATFRLLIGNFEESTALFTGINNAISGFVQNSANARNAMLQTWKDMGGRTLLIETLQIAFQKLMAVLKPIGDAFRSVFPKMTGERLFAITLAVNKFVKAITPSNALIMGIGAVMKIWINIMKILWSVVGQGIGFIFDLVKALFGLADSGQVTSGLQKISAFFENLAKTLTGKGGQIAQFFKDLFASIQDLPALLQAFKDKIVGLFDGVDPKVPDALADSMGRFSDRFKTIKDAFGGLADLWAPFSNAMKKVATILEETWIVVRDWFKQLGQKIADNMGEGDFDAVLDAINIGLLTAIAALLARFFKKGFKFDLTGGAFDKIKEMFEGLTGVFSAMQTKLKSEALLKIAVAIGILTASVLVLSLIDSANLSKALGAMAVGFGQLMAAFAILTKMTLNPASAASFTILAGGMVILSVAILILAAAAKTLGDMKWDELAKGLIGVTVLLAALSLAAKPLAANAPGMMAAGLSLIPIAIALVILSKAVGVFAQMDWSELAKGLTGMVIGIVGLGLAMRTFPSNMAATGLGLFFVSISLRKISDAVLIFAGFDWGTMLKGIFGMSLALAAIGLAMNTFPGNMPLTALGLLLVSVALIGVQKAVAAFGGMDWGAMVKGLIGMGGALLILGVGLTLMSGTIGGAIALGIAAVSLGILLKVMKEFAKIKIPDLVRGLIAMAASLAVIAAAALLLGPAIPFMLGLGVALALIGAGFALFGVGAAAVAKAFELFAEVGPKGAEAFTKAMQTIAKAIPAFIAAVATGLVEAIVVFGEMAAPLAEALGKILGAVMDQLIMLIPKLGELLGVLITTVIDLLREKIPQFALLGIDILLGILQGIRDRIGDVVLVVGEIITAFLDALAIELPKIVTSMTDLWVATILSVAENLGRLAPTLMIGVPVALIKGFVDGMEQEVGKVWDWISGFVRTLIDKVKSALGINSPSTVFKDIGLDLIAGFFNGIVEAAVAVTAWFKALGKNIVSWVGDLLITLRDKGYQVIVGFWNGVQERWTGVVAWFGGLGRRVTDAIGEIGDILLNIGSAVIGGFKRGMEAAWRNVSSWLADRAKNVQSIFQTVLGIKSPSKVFMEIGNNVMLGLQIGLETEWKKTEKWLTNLNPADAVNSDAITSTFKKVINSAAMAVSEMDAVQPVITPVLDLSQVRKDATGIQSMFGQPSMALKSLGMANQISLGTTRTAPDETPVPTAAGNVTYEQNVYAPKQLSTADVYRQTRNLIAVRKEELAIP